MSQEEASNNFSIEEDSIVTSTIYSLKVPGEYSEKYSYSRYGNPTRDALESALSQLDNASFALTFSSKTAASLAVLSILQVNDTVIFSDILSFETFKGLGVNAEFNKLDDIKSLENSLTPRTKFVWIETPMSPFTRTIDIKKICDIVHTKSNALVVVDNSLLIQRPFELGADVIVYSLGEFIGGHGDVSAGTVLTNDEKLHEKLKYQQYAAGAVPSPFDCYIISRSLKTLSLRMERHSSNSVAVAQFLVKHPNVHQVFHPSLTSDVVSFSSIYPGIVSFKVEGFLEEASRFIEMLKTIPTNENIGGVKSSVSLPWTMSYSHLPEKLRLEVGVTNNLVRLSVGIEDVNVIIADLDKALLSMTATSPDANLEI